MAQQEKQKFSQKIKIFLNDYINTQLQKINTKIANSPQILLKYQNKKWIRIPLKIIGFSITAIMAITIFWFGFVIYYIEHASETKKIDFQAIGTRIVVFDKDKNEIARRIFNPGYNNILEKIPPWTIAAFVAVEDKRFYQHIGIDFSSIARAAIANIKAGKIVQGASTITQQLARNLFLKTEQSFKRKIEEALLAIWIETRLSKDEIIELYLNRIYFGNGSWGITKAAKKYFNKEVQQLNVKESAILAGLLNAPSRNNPIKNKITAQKRSLHVIEQMIELGFIEDDFLDNIQNVTSKNENENNEKSQTINYLIDLTLNHAEDYLGYKLKKAVGEIHIYTTIDTKIQEYAENAVEKWFDKNQTKYNSKQVAVVVTKPDGAIVALIGGRKYNQSQFNRAIKANRQPGSAFKPIIYLAAMQKGLTPFDSKIDEPVEIEGWKPKNYRNKYRGSIDLNTALSISSNSVAVQLAQIVGTDNIVNTARILGIGGYLHKHISIALGTSETNLLDLTIAYNSFANGGRSVTPYVILKILANKKNIYQRKNIEIKPVLQEKEVSFMNYMLINAVERGTGRNAAIENWQIAGKTGTTQNFKDSWFIGYSSYYTAGVWIGNDDGKPMQKLTGGKGAAVIWKNFMEPIHQKLKPQLLPQPYNVENQEYQKYINKLHNLIENINDNYQIKQIINQDDNNEIEKINPIVKFLNKEP